MRPRLVVVLLAVSCASVCCLAEPQPDDAVHQEAVGTFEVAKSYKFLREDAIEPDDEPRRRRPPRKRKRRPAVQLDDLDRRPWTPEMEEEGRLRPRLSYRRRKLPPKYEEPPATDLRTLLKHSDSLSELLQRRNLSLIDLLQGGPKAVSALTELPAEATTEHRIFVPSHPKYYTSINFKPLYDAEVVKASEPSVKTEPEGPLSIAIEIDTIDSRTADNLVEKDEATTRAIHTITTSSTTTATPTTTTTEPATTPIRTTATTSTTTTTTTTTTTPRPAEKTRTPTAQEEIEAILRDSTSGANLTRILEERNMTINELVEQRERGSSQRHLADIFHNKTKEPEPKEAPLVGVVVGDGAARRLPKELEDQLLAMAAPSPTSGVKITSFPTYKVRADTAPPSSKMPPAPYPTWQQPDNFFQPEPATMMTSLPAGVRSAILASALIIGLSLVVFVTIFATFRWSQKRRRVLCYRASFESKIKTPILSGPRSTIGSIVMNATLGRKAFRSVRDKQSMQDEWRVDDGKPFQ